MTDESQENVLVREYFKACIRAQSASHLDGLDDDTLRAVWVASGPPRVKFDDWVEAVTGQGLQVPSTAAADPADLTDEEIEKANTKAMSALKVKAASNKGLPVSIVHEPDEDAEEDAEEGAA